MNLYQLVCPHCFASHFSKSEPTQEELHTCEQCNTVFKTVIIDGTTMTANAGESIAQIAASMGSSSIPPDFFDLINRNRGQRIFSESNPTGDNWVKRVFLSAVEDWRSGLSEAALISCPCPECRGELAKRAKNGCMAPQPPAGCEESFNDGSAPFGGVPEDAVPTVPEIMAEAAETFKQRNALYGDSYKHFHEVMLVLFPDGMHLKTADDWRRFGILFYAIGKLVRYCNNFGDGGHIDSAHDLGVYSFMLEEVSRIGLKEKGL